MKREPVYLEDEAVYKFVIELLERYLPLSEEGAEYEAEELYDVLLAAASQDTSIDSICHSSEAGRERQHGAPPGAGGV